MRKALIASTFAAAGLIAVAGGVAVADDTDRDPAPASPTTMPGGDIFSSLGLTPEQGQCLVDNMSGVDLNDITAMTELISECGITMDQLADISMDDLNLSDVPGVPTSSDDSIEPSDEEPVAVVDVLAAIGLEAADLECIESGLADATAAPGDETAALELLETCDVSLIELLQGLVTLDADGPTEGPATTGSDDVVTSEAATSENPMVAQLQEMLAQQGIDLDADQVSCIVDNFDQLDLSDMNSIATVLETCGVEVADLQ